MTPRVWPLLASLALVASACSSLSALPTYELGASSPAGVIEGALLRRGDCVYIEADGASLVVWPRSYARLGEQIMDNGQPVAQVGESVRLGGGSITYELLMRPPLSAVIPASCRTTNYWMATGVVPPLPRPTP